jgi:beta-lactamase superfamily II metal-dependent hydrolase
MIFGLEIQRAHEGDCFIMHYGTKEDPGIVLIDGGPSQVYDPDLKTRIEEIRKNRGLGIETPLWVDLLIISHIDEDHIQGILELMDDLANDYAARRPLPLKIQNFWHNTVKKIVGNNPDELVTGVKATHGAAALNGEIETEGLDPGVAKILASIPQGIEIYDYLVQLKWDNRINLEFNGDAVMAQKGGELIEMPKGGLKLRVVGPMQLELETLQKKYESYLKEHPKERERLPILATIDKENTFQNLSSIVVLAEYGGKRMLLTGDARGDKILEGLQLTGLLGTEKDSTIKVDLLKVPHHGSARNFDLGFFQRIIAKHYVFSADGKYGNPERETMEMLWTARGEADYTIHLTYEIPEIDKKRQEDWIKHQNSEKDRQKKEPKKEVKVREDWLPEKHSLEAFFKEHNIKVDPDPVEEGKPYVSIVKEGQPHIIDLMQDKVEF